MTLASQNLNGEDVFSLLLLSMRPVGKTDQGARMKWDGLACQRSQNSNPNPLSWTDGLTESDGLHHTTC